MSQFEEIFTRLYDKLGISKDSEFCKKYDIASSTLSSWKNRNSIPYEKLIEITHNEELSLDYILKGIEDSKSSINYKKEIVDTLDTLNDTQLEYIYHVTKAEKLKTQK